LAINYKKNAEKNDALSFYNVAIERFLNIKKKDKAIECYKEILDINPENVDNYLYLADLCDDNEMKSQIYLKGALYFITQKLSKEAILLCDKAKAVCLKRFINYQPYLNILEQESNEQELIENCMKLAKEFEEANSFDDAMIY
jgi:hypothetical protein